MVLGKTVWISLDLWKAFYKEKLIQTFLAQILKVLQKRMRQSAGSWVTSLQVLSMKI